MAYHALPQLSVEVGALAARGSVGLLVLDPDVVEEGNLGRQWPTAMGRPKAEVLAEMLDPVLSSGQDAEGSQTAMGDLAASTRVHEHFPKEAGRVSILCWPDNHDARVFCWQVSQAMHYAGVTGKIEGLVAREKEWLAGEKKGMQAKKYWELMEPLLTLLRDGGATPLGLIEGQAFTAKPGEVLLVMAGNSLEGGWACGSRNGEPNLVMAETSVFFGLPEPSAAEPGCGERPEQSARGNALTATLAMEVWRRLLTGRKAASLRWEWALAAEGEGFQYGPEAKLWERKDGDDRAGATS